MIWNETASKLITQMNHLSHLSVGKHHEMQPLYTRSRRQGLSQRRWQATEKTSEASEILSKL